MNPRKISILIVLALALPSSLSAIEITGKVAAVSGVNATIALDGDVLPTVGDKVDVFFKIGNAEVAVGSGRVTAATAGSIKAKIDNATGTVTPNQLVRIALGRRSQTTEKESVPPASAEMPQPAEAKLSVANRLYNSGDYDQAISACTEAINIGSDNAMAYKLRGQAFLQKHDYDSAINDWKQAIATQPSLGAELNPQIAQLAAQKEQSKQSGPANVPPKRTSDQVERADLTNVSQKLVGTWQIGQASTRFSRDGTFIAYPTPQVPIRQHGRWKVKGDLIVQYFSTREIVRCQIQSIDEKTMVLDVDGKSYHLRKVK